MKTLHCMYANDDRTLKPSLQNTRLHVIQDFEGIWVLLNSFWISLPVDS